jgi:hypothetical protein
MTYRKLSCAADAGNADAQYQLAAMLATGDGCGKDIKTAAVLYGKAAAQGHAEAMYNLGLMHIFQELPKSRTERGLALLEKAANSGTWDAQWFLADALMVGGHGLKKDAEKAAYHAVLALGCRYPNALDALGTRLKHRKLTATVLADALIRVARREPTKPRKREEKAGTKA